MRRRRAAKPAPLWRHRSLRIECTCPGGCGRACLLFACGEGPPARACSPRGRRLWHSRPCRLSHKGSSAVGGARRRLPVDASRRVRGWVGVAGWVAGRLRLYRAGAGRRWSKRCRWSASSRSPSRLTGSPPPRPACPPASPSNVPCACSQCAARALPSSVPLVRRPAVPRDLVLRTAIPAGRSRRGDSTGSWGVGGWGQVVTREVPVERVVEKPVYVPVEREVPVHVEREVPVYVDREVPVERAASPVYETRHRRVQAARPAPWGPSPARATVPAVSGRRCRCRRCHSCTALAKLPVPRMGRWSAAAVPRPREPPAGRHRLQGPCASES